jgi:hypothetical protein
MRTLVTASLLLMPMLASAANIFTSAGHNCHPYYPIYSFDVERQYARLMNPQTNDRTVWVTCPVTSSGNDLQNVLSGMDVNVFFEDVLLGQTVSCYVAQYPWNSRFKLGQSYQSAEVHSYNTTSHTPIVTSDDGLGEVYFLRFRNMNHDMFRYTTVSCRLLPGSGINSIDYYQGSNPN